MRDYLRLVLVLILTAVLYLGAVGSYFYGYDDFYVVHRTAFEDTKNPSAMVATTHFQSAKYRPGARLLDFAAFHLGQGSPVWFRIRNAGSHLATVGVLYWLALYLFGSTAIAAPAALLFGLHPLANQSILAASWTVTPAAFLLLASLALLIRSRKSARPAGWLVAALTCLLFSLFVYEAGIVMVGLWLLYLVSSRPSKRFAISVLVGLGVALGTFFLARALVVSYQPDHGSLGSIIRNLTFFGGALLAAPADSVLANDWLGLPLPSEIRLSEPGSLLLPALTALGSLVGIGYLIWKSRHNLPWIKLAILAGSIPLWLLPFLLFSSHASETYLYLPAASASLFIAAVLQLALPRRAFQVVVGLLALTFGAAAYNRTRHVISGAVISERIVHSFPLKLWTQGPWEIYAAEAEPPLPRYGLYSYRGLSTIDVGDPGIPGLQDALQLSTGNLKIKATVISNEQMTQASCPPSSSCYWVYGDGRVVPTAGAVPAP